MSATIGKTPAGSPVAIDVDRLIVSRLLVQANSGAGKSWALRRLLEQTHGGIQQIVLDVEGEFYTIREKHDFILARAGERDRDCPAEPRGAALLARKLLELGVSAVVDIYELKAHERTRFAKLFLDALVNAPRELWHPCLVIVDEAHVFCPQRGEAESAQSVIDLMTRGRKRGFCGVLATQRLSKLHKDAAAEANNKLIGRTSLDVDMERAGDELGFSKTDRVRLRTLEPGHFFAYGPALTSSVSEVVVGPVATTHPKPGQRAASAPPARAKVQKVLGQLADLPREAEEEARTLAEAKTRVRELERELRAARAEQAPAPPPERIEVPILRDSDLEKLGDLEAQLEDHALTVRKLMDRLSDVHWGVTRTNAKPPASATSSGAPAPRAATPSREPSGDLTGPQQAILDTVAMLNVRGIPVTRDCVARWLGIHPNGGSYGANLGRLRAEGYLEGFTLTIFGEQAAAAQESL